ncbi:MAG: peptidoglycan-associated lipoprotein Pal [Proteobacteria bacterium]|nr:peptidoglycan-associated lipoprotein Pal [Pseudomonadota bacterium]
MQRNWLRNLSVVAFAALVLVGCSSTGKKAAQTGPLPGDEQPEVTAPGQSDSEISRVDAEGNPINPQTGMPLSRVFYFDYDKAMLQPDSLAVLELHAVFLKNNSDRRVVIDGFTDERGTREYNLALGERRAESVATFLVSQGVRRSQIDVVSYGEERPADPGHSEAAWAKNRRAELVYR